MPPTCFDHGCGHPEGGALQGIYVCMYIYRVAQKMYTLFTHQYLWNKFK